MAAPVNSGRPITFEGSDGEKEDQNEAINRRVANLRTRFPNLEDLRTALKSIENSDLYRKAIIKDLTRFGRIRDAYHFAKELDNTPEREILLRAVALRLVRLDAFDELKECFSILEPQNSNSCRYAAGNLYLDLNNFPRFFEVLFSISDVQLNRFLITRCYRKVSADQKKALIVQILSTYARDNQVAYCIQLIKELFPSLLTVDVEATLVDLSNFLINENRFEQLHLILSELTTRRKELIDRTIVLLLDRNEVNIAVDLAKNLGQEKEYILYCMGEYLFNKGQLNQIHVVINAMTERRVEFVNKIISILLERQEIEIAIGIVKNMNSDVEVYLQAISQHLNQNNKI